MKESIYNLLNDIDSSPESYTTAQVTQKDIKDWKKAFKNKEQNSSQPGKRALRKHRYVKYAAAAAAAVVLICAGSIPSVRITAYAAVKSVTYNLGQLLGISADLSPYTTVVGESVSKDGITVTLNEVIMDENMMYITDTVTTSEKMDTVEKQMGYMADAMVFINGKMASSGASGGIEQADDYNLVSTMEIDLPDIDTSGTVDMEIRYSVEGREIGTIAFTASGAELLADTVTIPLNEVITLPDDSTLSLEKYTTSEVGQKIFFTLSPKKVVYDVILKGEDNLGNPVEFITRSIHDGQGRMEVSTIDNGYVNDQAESLTLTPYAVRFPETSGKMSNDYQPVGEAFTIQLK